MQKEKNTTLLMLEGNIGSGKSTFLKILKDRLDIEAIFEPTNKWQHAEDENNLLHLFYQDTPRWAYTFQSYAFISRIQVILEALKKNNAQKVNILERSVYCDRYCFAKNCFESGLMSRLEWQIYKEWFSWLAEKYTPQPNAFIYLQTEPTTCFNRINKRNRKEETTIPLQYLTQLHKRHEEWLVQQKEISSSLAMIPTLVLDCNEEFETSIDNQNRLVEKVKNFIDQKISPLLPGQIHQTERQL